MTQNRAYVKMINIIKLQTNLFIIAAKGIRVSMVWRTQIQKNFLLCARERKVDQPIHSIVTITAESVYFWRGCQFLSIDADMIKIFNKGWDQNRI